MTELLLVVMGAGLLLLYQIMTMQEKMTEEMKKTAKING